MGSCKFCGKSAGLFSNAHAECSKEHQAREQAIRTGADKIVAEIANAINGGSSFELLEIELAKAEISFSISQEESRQLLIKGWEQSVDLFMDDGLLDEVNEQRLVEFLGYFDIRPDDLAGNEAMTKCWKATTLRRVLNGLLPSSEPFGYRLPINLQRGERVIWAFPNSRYLEDKTFRQYGPAPL